MPRAPSRQQLLQRIEAICSNPSDPVTLDTWEELTLEELRTVVALLSRGGVRVIMEYAPRGRRNPTSHCYLLEGLVEHLRRNPNATNPLTRRPVTQQERQTIYEAYSRITGNPAPSAPAAQPAQSSSRIELRSNDGRTTLFIDGNAYHVEGLNVTYNIRYTPNGTARQVIIEYASH